VLFGAFRPPALERVARWGDGFLCAAPLEYSDHMFRTVERSWDAAGRSGRPRLVAQVNVALGSESVVDEARAAIRSYCSFDDYADHVVAAMLTTPDGIRKAITAFGDLGADEVMLYCWSGDPDQIDWIADGIS
jgi:alkanesulfonate monooxygenase SsuD/methylene tetrahydromethanopterin reductase-like flavin-dependent oxidoreductase (luciferase family)